MRRWLFLLLVLVLSLGVASVASAQEDGASADPNACLTGGSMEGQCDFPTAAEDEWAWTCGYYVGLYDNGEISRDQIPDWCYYQVAGADSNCLSYEVVDYLWIGPVNTANNVAVFLSADGSCSGPMLGTATVVEAPNEDAAEALCDTLTSVPAAQPLDPAIMGQPNLWSCLVI